MADYRHRRCLVAKLWLLGAPCGGFAAATNLHADAVVSGIAKRLTRPGETQPGRLAEVGMMELRCRRTARLIASRQD